MSGGLIRFFKVWSKGFGISMGEEMAYKMSFILTVISMIFMDVIGPLITLAIYTVSSGIPGWSLMEFILMQGVVIFIFGFWHTFIGGISWVTADYAAEGELDTVLLKPFSTVAYMAIRGIDFHGLAEVLVGIVLIVMAIIKLNLISWMLGPFIFLIILALVFVFSISLIIATLSIIFVRVYALQNVIDVLGAVAGYPKTVYSTSIRFFITFIVPAAVAGYWPAALILGKEAMSSIFLVSIPVVIILLLSLLFWNIALRRYQSAGG